jgi:hypothetical protein
MRWISVGRVSVGLYSALAAVSVLAACGHSEQLDRDDGSADAGGGGTAGAGAGAGLGGSMSTGGITTNGGVGGSSGSIGAGGGSTACSDCPDADYRVVVDGDGDSFAMLYNGRSELSLTPECSEQPLRGGAAGCGRSIFFSACSGPKSGPPCLEIYRGMARYIDATGQIWGGIVQSDMPSTSAAGVHSGALTIELVGSSEAVMTLRVEYTFCSPLSVLLIPC